MERMNSGNVGIVNTEHNFIKISEVTIIYREFFARNNFSMGKITVNIKIYKKAKIKIYKIPKK